MLSRGPSLTPSIRRVRHKKTFLKEQAVHRVQFQSTNVCWKVKCGRKRCTTKRDDRSLKNIVKKSRFQNLGELQRQWTEAGVQVSKATVHRRVGEMGSNSRVPVVKPPLNSRQRKKRLTWAVEKKHRTVAEWSSPLFRRKQVFIWKSRRQRLEKGWRGAKSKLLEIQCEVPSQ
uniref:Transposase Tc1-like domain-containing protein n=1 Tax=Gasterosteus aculeatus aculeatus TaxID=481459 RepID=A0AAQ4RTS1_GASAC